MATGGKAVLELTSPPRLSVRVERQAANQILSRRYLKGPQDLKFRTPFQENVPATNPLSQRFPTTMSWLPPPLTRLPDALPTSHVLTPFLMALQLARSVPAPCCSFLCLLFASGLPSSPVHCKYGRAPFWCCTCGSFCRLPLASQFLNAQSIGKTGWDVLGR